MFSSSPSSSSALITRLTLEVPDDSLDAEQKDDKEESFMPSMDYQVVSNLLVNFLDYAWFFVRPKNKEDNNKNALRVLCSKIFTDEKRAIFNENGALLPVIKRDFPENISDAQRKFYESKGFSVEEKSLQVFFGDKYIQEYIDKNIKSIYIEKLKVFLENIYALINSAAMSERCLDISDFGEQILAMMSYFGEFNEDMLARGYQDISRATLKDFAKTIIDLELSLGELFSIAIAKLNCLVQSMGNNHAESSSSGSGTASESELDKTDKDEVNKLKEALSEKSQELERAHVQLMDSQESLAELKAQFDFHTDVAEQVEKELKGKSQEKNIVIMQLAVKLVFYRQLLNKRVTPVYSDKLVESLKTRLQSCENVIAKQASTIATQSTALKLGAGIVACASMGILLFKCYRDKDVSASKQLVQTASAIFMP